MSLEMWKSFFEFGGAILLFLTFIFGVGALLTTRKVNERQGAELRAVGLKLSEQQERAANAEKELLEVKERVKRQSLPRWSLVEPLSNFLRNKPQGSVEIIFVPEDDEALKTALSLEAILSADAKWKILRNAHPYSEDDVVPNFLTPALKENPFHITLFERVGGLSDITVLFSAADASEDRYSPRAGTAAEALWRGLHVCGFETIAAVDPRLAIGTARIVVGPKR